MGFSRQEYWSGLQFPSPVNNILSELSTMTCLSWVPLNGMAHSCIDLDKAVVHVIHCWPIPPQETLKHSEPSLALSLWVLLLCTRFGLSPLSISGRLWGLILNAVSTLLPSCWSFSFAFGCGYLFLVGSNILLLMVIQQRVVILEFSQEKISACPTLPG